MLSSPLDDGQAMLSRPSLDNRMMAAPRVVVIGNPESNRTLFLQEALTRLGRAPAVVVPWLDMLTGAARLDKVVTHLSAVRIESPGKNFAVERALLTLGADISDDEQPRAARISKRACGSLAEDRGLILAPRQWYLGFRAALSRIEEQLAECPAHRVTNAPDEIAVMFDKRACHARLQDASIPVPSALGPVSSYEELVGAMRQTGYSRVFLKLAHGSSASGVVAYQAAHGREQATTTVEMVDAGGETKLYNSRRIRTYRDSMQIARLIDALCAHGAHCERWVPKAGLEGRTFDLRVVVIAGRTRHCVARMSRGPITNLHLLNRRGDPEAVRARMGDAAWQSAMTTCEDAMRCFPGSLYAGLDLAWTPDFRSHAILEVNAFGDLLPGILFDGQDTYAAEALAL